MLQVEADQLQTYLGAPWCLGRVAEFYPRIENGERFAHKITLLDHDYVIWADPETNEVYAFDNVCPHAGASLGNGGYLTTRSFTVPNQSESVTRECLACPYHGHQVQFLKDGRAIVNEKATAKPLQAKLEITVRDGLVWTYGLHWQKIDGRWVAQQITPKLPIPDYSHVFTRDGTVPVDIATLQHISTQERSVETNILHFVLNLHDAQHFAEVHKDTMLSQEVAVRNFHRKDNSLRWQLVLEKRRDKAAKRSPYAMMVKDHDDGTYFNTYLPGFAITAYDFAPGQNKIVYDVISIYPESKTRTHLKLTNFRNFDLPWYFNFLGGPKRVNQFRLDLVSEDVRNLEHISDDYERKINLEHDEPVVEALKYLQSW